MLGAIAGDVIGSPYEFDNIRTTVFPLFSPECAITDDSVLTVAVADVILRGDGDYASRFYEYVAAFPNPKGSYGSSFASWARRRDGRPYNSWGNGSAMRVSPVAWAFESLDDVLLEAKRSAEVTHNHPEGIRGAEATAAAIYVARTTRDRDRVRQVVAGQFGYGLDGTVAELQRTNEFDESCQGTVPVAVIAVLESTGFEDAVRKAVSVGGDSDTIACIAGAIAHALYQDIPREIVDRLFQRHLNARLADVTRRFMRRYNVPPAIDAPPTE
jgi:ADP-ribosylglycohydrolase